MSSRIERTVTVSWRHQVLFTQNVFDAENATLRDVLVDEEEREPRKTLCIIDEALADVRPVLVRQIQAYFNAHADTLKLVGPPIVMEGGERTKNSYFHVSEVHSQIDRYHIDRHSYVLAIGGGAVLDAVGLVAATAPRGIRHIRIPTTVLAQSDSGVGVKNGVNLYGVKNYIGTFSPPFAVLNDIEFVMGLGERDKIAGMAEAVKVALIRSAEFFGWLEINADALSVFERGAMASMIRRCARLHMHQICHGGDPFEMGSARPLDYGHWSAHKLESLTRHHVRHGEAVAIGMALDARYSVLAGLLASGGEDRICFLLEHLGFDLWHPALQKYNAEGGSEILVGLRDFREHLGGELTITLLAELGVGIEVHEMDETLIAQSIDWLHDRRRP